MKRRGGQRIQEPSPPPAPVRTPARRVAAPVVLVLIIAFLFHLRMKPDKRHDVELQLDAVFNQRMTSSLLKDGAVPAVDPLSTYPEGKPVTALLPTGLYHACAAFSRFVNLFTSVPLRTVILLFCSLCGALIALPVYLISLHLYRSPPIALVSAALAGMIPAAMERTLCYWYRDEVLALPLLFLSLFFFLKIFDPSGDRGAIVNGSIAMTLLVIAFYVWRLCLLFLIADAIALVTLALRSRQNTRRVVMAGLLLFGVCGVLLLFIPGFGRMSQHSNYGGFPQAVWEISLNRLGVATRYSGFTRLVADNMELFSVGLHEMINRNTLSLSAGFPLVFLVSYVRRKERSPRMHIVFAFVVLIGTLTVLVYRNVAFLAPLVAITAGESLSLVRELPRERKLRDVMLAMTFVFLTKTAMDGHRMAAVWHRDARLGNSLVQVLTAIRDSTPSGAVVACSWPDGYMVQSYCNRPTLTDGLFESQEIVSRILEESEAYYSDNEDRLWAYCTRHGATHLLVPMRRTLSYADQAGVPYETYFGREGPTEAGKATVLYRLMHEPQGIKRFQQVYRNSGYVLYQVAPAG